MEYINDARYHECQICSLHMQSRSGWGVGHIGSEKDGEEITYPLEGQLELQDRGLCE
jgi:hypothetical protein